MFIFKKFFFHDIPSYNNTARYVDLLNLFINNYDCDYIELSGFLMLKIFCFNVISEGSY